MKILVTGGAGFIGSHLVEELQGKADIYVIDNFRTGKIENLNGFKLNLIEGSINDKELLREVMVGIDFVFHMAAAISVVESMENPIKYVETNTIGTLNILEEAAKTGVKKVLFCSSSAIYGESLELPKTEDMKVEPLSPYAITKLDGEYYCNLFTKEKGLKTVCTRFFNVFGPRQDPESQYAAAIPIFVSKAVNNEKITIYGDGKQTRDFIYVKDVVKACIYLTIENDSYGIFNVGYGKSIEINELVERILKKTNSKSPISYEKERPGEIKHSIASIKKLSNTNFKPLFGFDSGLDLTIDYFKKKFS
ncbi:MAG TPA: NAD-dependent epimerase/dehydratase family protein [Victivallales bacterium]|nr:NAD-dependent epimerase/dehydratase family protein [Victivallales bacterium]HPO90421.1 NAD-dependent epimerase/dehydratase family protein [Victivallales bacterium]HRR27889.1 NAD-dependent epimerase/dehydratase family protein [Victivallales bacterium]HRU00797.1 NAD-dependent epimerase/dehydratase family protein [Victivallales bacterium]